MNDVSPIQRRSTISKTALIGDSQIPAALGQTITGALANIPFPFGIDNDGNYGYRKDGADTVTPFKSGIHEFIFVSVLDGTTPRTIAVDEDGTIRVIYRDFNYQRNVKTKFTEHIDGMMPSSGWGASLHARSACKCYIYTYNSPRTANFAAGQQIISFTTSSTSTNFGYVEILPS